MTKKSMRVWATVAVMGLTAVVVSVSGGAVSASRADDVGKRYVALGDSVAFGHSPLLEDPWVPERFVGYPEVIAEQSGVTTTNLSCPGQTARALTSRRARDTGCFDERESAAAEGRAFLHTDYSGTQLDAALEAVRSDTPPSLISIQGGANDMTWCGEEARHPEKCLDDALPKITASLRQAVAQLRAAGSHARVVLVGYHLVPDVKAQLRRVNRAVERAARQSHVAFADVAVPFERYARRHHGDLCTTGLVIELPDGSCDLHPSPTGQNLYADSVLEAASRKER
jgi:lysophospholipase L1-like esterase